MQLTGEQIRFHAAGHLAAAHALILSGHDDGARVLLNIIQGFVDYEDRPGHKRGDHPPAVRDLLTAAIDNPNGCRDKVAQLEAWFVDPLNNKAETFGLR